MVRTKFSLILCKRKKKMSRKTNVLKILVTIVIGLVFNVMT